MRDENVSDRGVKSVVLSDGSLLVSDKNACPWLQETRAKNEHEVKQAIAELRANGDPKPVVFKVAIEGFGVPHGKQVFPLEGEYKEFVMRRKDARALLKRVLPFPSASKWFPATSKWPVSYYRLEIDKDGRVETGESRFLEDCEPGLLELVK